MTKTKTLIWRGPHRRPARVSKVLLLSALALGTAVAGAGCTAGQEPVEQQSSAIEAATPETAPLELHESAADGHRLYRGLLAPALPETERSALFALFLAAPGETDRTARRILPLERVADARLAPKGGRVAALTEGGRLLLSEAAGAGRTIDVGVLPGLAFSSDGMLLAYSRRDDDPRPELHLHDLRRGESRPLLERHLGSADRPAFSAGDDFLFAVGSDDRTGLAQLWALALPSGRRSVLTNQNLEAPSGDGRPPQGFLPLPVGPVPARHQGGQLIYGSGDATVWLPVHLDARTGSAKAGTPQLQPITSPVEESR